jgi:hypothetical protein
LAGFVWIACLLVSPAQADDALRDEASQGLERAVQFYAGQVASHGGYVYRYSADLTKREGEGQTELDTVWVQPPGTPAVGMALVEAYEVTGRRYLLDAARAAGECLLQGQLRSGGWTNRIEFAPDRRKKVLYRVDPPRKRGFNTSSFDDDQTQSCLRFLARLDAALGFSDPAIHEATKLAFDSVLKAQFPNGGWAQGWQDFPDASEHTVAAATYPDSWPREYPGGDYWWHYTLNDNTVANTIASLLLAASIYDEPRYREAAVRAGDFLLLAQLPEPQPAWAQQYDFDMHPAWARKFEPPAVSGAESQGVIRALFQLYLETGDQKYLKPVPAAIAYLRQSLRPDGRLARFYELRTNKPLYLTREYKLTYDDNDLPTHYGFIVDSDLDALAQRYESLNALSAGERTALRRSSLEFDVTPPDERAVREVLASLDDRGAWVEVGRLLYHGKRDDTRRIIDSRTFIRNVGLLSRFIGRD